MVFDTNTKPREALAREGATAAGSLAEMMKTLTDKPRAVWVMLPAGEITEKTVEQLGGLLKADDIIIDGGNSFYKDDIRRAAKLAGKHIRYHVDCGTSGSVWGIERGYCLMIGGPKEAVDHLDPIFAALAPGLGDIPRTPGREKAASRAERGYIHAGPSGAGHFVKMVHNGIEYGLMQAYAEGFDILRNKDARRILPEDRRFTLNMPDIAEVWRRGSVISSWLLDLGAAALAKDPQLKDFSGFVKFGEGRWTVEAAIEEAVPADVLSTALYATRFRSRKEHTFGEGCCRRWNSASAAISRVGSATPNRSRQNGGLIRRQRTLRSSAHAGQPADRPPTAQALGTPPRRQIYA